MPFLHTPRQNTALWLVFCPTNLHLIPLPAARCHLAHPAGRPSVSLHLSDGPGKPRQALRREGGSADYLLSVRSHSAGSVQGPLLLPQQRERLPGVCNAPFRILRAGSGQDAGATGHVEKFPPSQSASSYLCPCPELLCRRSSCDPLQVHGSG